MNMEGKNHVCLIIYTWFFMWLESENEDYKYVIWNFPCRKEIKRTVNELLRVRSWSIMVKVYIC